VIRDHAQPGNRGTLRTARFRLPMARSTSDDRRKTKKSRTLQASGLQTRSCSTRNRWLPDLVEAAKMALNSMRVNLFRTALTLLGVVIGVAAVVAMLAIGDGSKQQVLERISSMGTNLLVVRPGAARVRGSGDIATLVEEDARAISELSSVAAISPERATRATVRFGNVDYQTLILQGAWPGYTQARDWATRRKAASFQRRRCEGLCAGNRARPDRRADTVSARLESPVGKYHTRAKRAVRNRRRSRAARRDAVARSRA
jgi:hypothetical protein